MECKNFDPGQIRYVKLTSTGYDGWRGLRIAIQQPGFYADCPIGAWLNDKGSFVVECETTIGEDIIELFKHNQPELGK